MGIETKIVLRGTGSSWNKYEAESALSTRIAAAQARCNISAAVMRILKSRPPTREATEQETNLLKLAHFIGDRKGEVMEPEVEEFVRNILDGKK